MSTQPGKTKIAGAALLGVAGVALVLGIVSAAGVGSGPSNAASESSTHQAEGAQKPGNGQTESGTSGGGGQQGPGKKQGGQNAGGTGQHPGQRATTVIQPPNPQEIQREQQQANQAQQKRGQRGNQANQGRQGNNQLNQQGQGQGQNQQVAARAAATKSAPVRVYNNSTIKGLASRAAAELRADGFKVVSVGNYPDGVIPTTTVYYRPGTGEQATAQAVAQQIGAKCEPRFPGLQKASPGVIVIVTQDYHG